MIKDSSLDRAAVPFLRMEQVSFTYPDSLTPALSDISFSLAAGEIGVLCGASGCGKTTLLKHIKNAQAPFGERSGRITIGGTDIKKIPGKEGAARIGFVGQVPDEQIVTDTVWHELSFGMENLGYPTELIRRRTAEIAEYFGISSWFRKKVSWLSGGQKQILNLAAVMVMQPELLILDEPVSQLDPIAAGRFWQTLLRLNQDFGTTVLLAEQQLERVLEMADLVVVMDQGGMLGAVPPAQLPELISEAAGGQELSVLDAFPAALRTYMEYGKDPGTEEVPVSVRDGRRWLCSRLSQDQGARKAASVPNQDQGARKAANGPDQNQGARKAVSVPDQDQDARKAVSVPDQNQDARKAVSRPDQDQGADKPEGRQTAKEAIKKSERREALRAKNLVFGYGEAGKRARKSLLSGRRGSEREAGRGSGEKPVLEHFFLTVQRGEIFGILGGNGSGKTTALKVLAGVHKPWGGSVESEGRVYYLAQNPQSIFTEITVWEELGEAFESFGRRDGQREEQRPDEAREETAQMLKWLGLEAEKERNPMDLSGGQQQKLALGKLLLRKPDVLLLDEPTKGMDAAFKKKLAGYLKELALQGMTLVIASHDLEFCAWITDRCGLLFDGQMISCGRTRAFFADNQFYTTQARRMTAGILEDCILWEDIIKQLQ